MYLPPLFVLLLLSSFVTPTEETLQFELPSILTSFFGIGNNGSSLSRHKRAASASIKEYSVDIEVSFQDPILQSAIKTLIANLSFPINLTDSATSIQRINVTTVCNQVGDNLQCACEEGFIWAPSICNANTPCDVSTKDSCNCINVTVNNGLYCKAKDASNVKKSFSLQIEQEFIEDLKDSSTPAYKNLTNLVETQLFISYNTLPGFESAEVTGFRKGSVLADYTIVAEAVTDATMQEANDRFTANIKNNLTLVDPAIVAEHRENITLSNSSPSTDVFVGDRVTLSCDVIISSYTVVYWYLNEKDLANTSYRTTVSSGIVKSTLTIPNVASTDEGTYKCIVVLNTDSYLAEYNLTAQNIAMNTLNTNVPCDSTNVSIVGCCPSGQSDALQLTCQNISGNYNTLKSTYLDPGTLCRVLSISATLEHCVSELFSTYSCTCFSRNGASKSGTVTVNYGPPSLQISGNDNVSQGDPIELVCATGASIRWTFTRSDGSFSGSVQTGYYNNTKENSTLIIPGNVINLNWDGTFLCSSGQTKAQKKITVISLLPTDQISTEPITFFYTCGQARSFNCCVQNNEDHYTRAELITSSSTISMTKNGLCFSVTHSFSNSCTLDPFDAGCRIFNKLNATRTSRNMTGRGIPVEDNNCKDPTGLSGSKIQISCTTLHPTKTGTLTLMCTKKIWSEVESESTCVSLALSRLSVEIQELTSPGSEFKIPGILLNISIAAFNESATITNSSNDIKNIVDLLTKVGELAQTVEVQTMQDFLNTVDVVVDNSSINTWRTISNESDRLLSSVETFARKLNFTTRFDINNTNLRLVGIIADGRDKSFGELFRFTNNLTGNVFISDLSTIKLNTSIVSIGYSTLKDILPLNNSSDRDETLNGLVMAVIANRTENKPFKLSLDYKISNTTLTNASCVFWDIHTRKWNDFGCRRLSSTDTDVSCECDHLTSFSILMSPDSGPNLRDDQVLAYITYIGVGISILSLVICIGIEATVWKSVTKNKTSYMRHVCIVNIAVSLLIADIWFIVGAALADMITNAAANAVLTSIRNACVAVTFFTHLFYLSVFFWMLTMALILFYRLVYVFHDLSKTVMMSISFVLGYGCPLVISVITVAVTQPSEKYRSEYACWLISKDTLAFLAFIVPAFVILFVNIIILCVVLRKLCRPAIGDKQKKDEAETLKHIAKCIVILTPLLGLTWGLGIGTMFSKEKSIHGIFAAVNSLQGFFILLFGCLLDKKVREALFNKFSFSRFSSQQTKSTNISSSDSPFSKTVMSRGVLNLFAKKGSYNINSAQESSSSSDIPSNSYSLLQ
uniref:Adhesion G protein-coupled receptor F5 n=1 Tax=Leptobrachium leishanense TaxID=445787 RepID=A0A8C5MIQ3_9ANUR